MYHIVYLTTNIVNHKYYIGIHSTYDLNDGYLGSGLLLLRGIKKYGKDKFERKILHFCLTKEDAAELEKSIVDDNFVNNSKTYNLQNGGSGKTPVNKKYAWSDERKAKHSKLMAERYANGKQPHLKRGGDGAKNNAGKKQSEEHIKKRAEARRGSKHSKETKQLLSQKMSATSTCIHCDVVSSKSKITQYHNDNCKFKDDIHD